MGKGLKWEIEDEKLLKKYFTTKNREELLSIFPNRTWKAIRSKANSMGLKIRNDYKFISKEEMYKEIDGEKFKKCKSCRRYLPSNMKYFPKDEACKDGLRGVCKECKGENFNISNAIAWTLDEIDILTKNYQYYSNYEMVKNFFPYRKEKHICDKASKLGLHKNDETLKRISIEKMSIAVRLKISKNHKEKAIFVGSKNPMYNSKRFKELNPNWKGGITTEKEVAMRSEEYKLWRKSVFERDLYTCQCCGKMTHDIEAHHLDNFADYKEKRYDIENGITLCKKCHNPNQKGSFHNECGTLHNTKEQFYIWMSNKKE